MEDNITLKNGLNGNNIVQKSTPLQSLWKSSLGLGEFKVLDTYLSRIDSHHPERRTVKFSKEEFEKDTVTNVEENEFVLFKDRGI